MSNNNNDQGSDSIYRAPSSNTAVSSGDNLMAAYVGPKNAQYYEDQFAKFESGGGAMSWHWPAFFVTWGWLIYRKMWLWFFIYWLGIPILLTIVSGLISASGSPEVGITFYYVSYVVTIFLLAPIFANRLYYQHVKGKVKKIASTSLSEEQQAEELARKGGTSMLAYVIVPLLLVGIIGILAAIAIPAYQDYTVRAQVSEGLNLAGGVKSAVVDAYRDQESWPVDNQSAGLPPSTSILGQYVSSVAVSDGAVIVTYGVAAHAIISGQTLILEPDVENGTIAWTCYSMDIEAKHLPAACR